MTIQAQVLVLEKLIQLDAVIRRIDTEVSQAEAASVKSRDALQKLDAQIAADQAALREMDKTRGELTGEARQLSQQVEKAREKLHRARNERETMACEGEVEELRRLMRDREIEAKRLAELGVAAKESIKASEEKRAALAGGATETAPLDAGTAAEIMAVRAGKLAERATLVTQLPAPILRRYDTIRGQRGSGACAIVAGNCSGCHISISPMVVQKIQRFEGFESCPSCKRLLFYAPTPVAEQPAPGA